MTAGAAAKVEQWHGSAAFYRDSAAR
jgi:hypothetical protein